MFRDQQTAQLSGSALQNWKLHPVTFTIILREICRLVTTAPSEYFV